MPAPFTACAVLGLLPLCCSTQLVLATRRERAATLRGAPLWRVAATRLLACGADDGDVDEASAATHSAAAAERAADASYVALLRLALAEPGLYYCDGADATRSEQAAAAAAAELGAGRLRRPFSVRAPFPTPPRSSPQRGAAQLTARVAQETADGRFMWNAHLAAPLLAAGAAAFVPPLVCGWAGAAQAAWPEGGAAVLEVTLLARRHVGRPGRRLWTRGLDTCVRAVCARICLASRVRSTDASGHVC
jgi:hypothetical protein